MSSPGNPALRDSSRNGGEKMLSQMAEEVLESLWVTTQEGMSEGMDLEPEGSVDRDPGVDELIRAGLVADKAGKLVLLDEGLKEAQSVVRRHRLAERLMIDVLAIDGDLMEEHACRFEHLLREEVEESVCTLLGHPRECPHGKPIPVGPCCKRSVHETRSIVLPLCELSPGERGRIAYLRTADSRRLQKLLALGILPGVEVETIQRFPSFVFRMGHSQMAVDREIAEGIYVRLDPRKDK
jgi:DtxR family Mn-dependent transcriptional regulator